jgi:hypothetical protein
MKVKLYSTAKVEYKKVTRKEAMELHNSGKASTILPPGMLGDKRFTAYVIIPEEEREEELLGEFIAREYTAPNGSEWIEVNHGRGRANFRKGELVSEGEVNIFRIAII